MKKTSGKTVIFTVIGLLIAAAVIAVTAVMSSFIGKEAAEQIAYKDAGLTPPYSRTELGFEDGRFLYTVEFFSDGITYEYSILAKDGTLIHRNTSGSGNIISKQKTTEAPPAETTAPETTAPETPAETAAPETAAPETTPPETAAPETQPAATEAPADSGNSADPNEAPDPDRVEHAKTTALSNMGLADRLNDAEFTDTKWTKEGDKFILEFTFTIDDTEYVCKISEHGEFYSSESHPKN